MASTCSVALCFAALPTAVLIAIVLTPLLCNSCHPAAVPVPYFTAVLARVTWCLQLRKCSRKRCAGLGVCCAGLLHAAWCKLYCLMQPVQLKQFAAHETAGVVQYTSSLLLYSWRKSVQTASLKLQPQLNASLTCCHTRRAFPQRSEQPSKVRSTQMRLRHAEPRRLARASSTSDSPGA